MIDIIKSIYWIILLNNEKRRFNFACKALYEQIENNQFNKIIILEAFYQKDEVFETSVLNELYEYL